MQPSLPIYRNDDRMQEAPHLGRHWPLRTRTIYDGQACYAGDFLHHFVMVYEFYFISS